MIKWLFTLNKRHDLLIKYMKFCGIILSSPLILEIAYFLLFPQITLAQEGWKTLFQDDFEDGNLTGWQSVPGFQVEQENGNYILSGSGHSYLTLGVGNKWTDYQLNFRIKIIQEAAHLNVRHSNKGRYFIAFNEGGLVLNKQFWPDTFFDNLARADFPVSTGQWHMVSIKVQGSRIEVAVDGIARIGYTDNDTPLLQGTIALETIWDESSHLHFDDIDVVGEPPPTPPPPPPLPPNWTTLFQDDFGEGSNERWTLDSGWGIEQEDSNFVLSGEGHFWAIPNVDGRKNCVIETKFKLITGGFHLSFRRSEKRISETERVPTRYFLALSENWMSLNKQVGSDFFTLFQDNIDLDQGSWHTVRILLEEASTKVYLDNGLAVDVVDNGQPLLFGTFAFETWENSHIHFDDIVVYGEPPPTPPPGYVWKKTGGPSGGLGYDVRINPQRKDIMFVTDNPSGVNKSDDAGATWVQRNKGITTRTGPSMDGIPIFSLTIDPNNPDIIWAGTQNAKGIFKSIDGGETWTRKDGGITEGDEISFRNFCIHPQNSNIVFAGAEIWTNVIGKEFNKTKGKIYKTEDGGQNWRCIWAGDNLVRFVLLNPTNPNVLYASTGIFDREANNDLGVGILKSIDSGETWFQINNGLENLFIGFLEMHPLNPQILFAAAGNNAYRSGSGVYKTVDGGANWSRVLASSLSITAVTISPSNPNVIYAGGEGPFYRSDDGGNSWHEFQTPGGTYGPPGIRAGIPIGAVVDPTNPMTVFVNNYVGGVFKSADGGQTWVNWSKGYTGAHLHDIAIDAQNPAIVYTIGRSGPFRSFDGGQNWTGIAFPPANVPEWNAVAINPGNHNEILISNEANGGIYKTTDGGNSWRLVFKHPNASPEPVGDCNTIIRGCWHGFKDIVHAPSNPNIVYAGMRRDRGAIEGPYPASPSYGMYKSTDGGETWMEINNGLETSLINIHCIAVHPNNPNIVYIGAWKDGVFKTTDGGQNWVMKNNGLASADVRSLAIDPKNPEVVYAGLGEGVGVFKTINGGELWGEINNGLNLVCPSNLLPAGKVKLGISFEQPPKRVFSTDYYSVPWTSVWSIVIDPTNSQTIYAADHQSGVYMSVDGGANWVPIEEGLSIRAVTSMAISFDGKVLYAATEGGGVFRLDLNLFSDVPSDHWKGEYFDNRTLSGSPSMVRDDGTGFINFNWGTGSPSSTCGIGVDNFSVRWTRTVSFTSGPYRFTVTSDDGVRLYVDDQSILDKWFDQPPTTYEAEVSPSAGDHTIKMEYYEAAGGALASLSWKEVGCIVSVPQDHWKGEYFNNRMLSGSPIMVNDDGTGFIDFNWGVGSPGSECGVEQDNFSVRWTRTINFGAGTYHFTVTSDDGLRLYIDDYLILDKWLDQPPTTYEADVPLSAGNHSIKMEYYEAAGGAVASLSWAEGSCIVSVPLDHWKGEYFDNRTLSGPPSMVRDDGTGFIDFDWGTGSPSSACGIGSDNFSVRWTRDVYFDAGTYRFTVTSDDGCRLYVDGQPIFDKWFDQAPTTYEKEVSLSAGYHTIEMEYYEAGGGAVASLSWYKE